MLNIIKLPSFEKDIKILIKKHYKFDILFKIIEMIKNQETLLNKYKDHYLKGDKQGYKECHIDDNIILIYQVINNETLLLHRIGNHGDLLNK